MSLTHVTPSEELVLRYEGRADILRDILTTSPKALGPGVKNEVLGQLLFLLREATRRSFLPKVGNNMN